MRRTTPLLAATLTILTMTLAGCGQAGSPLMAAATTPGAGAQGCAPGGPGGPGMRRGGPQAPFAELNLSDEQKSKIKAITEKYRPQPPAQPPASDARMSAAKAVHDALLAETVDAAALRAALQTQQQDMASHQPPSQADMLAEIRAVLTSDQINQLVSKLQSAPAKPEGAPKPPQGADDKHNGFLAKLNLTDAQKAAFDALDAKRKAGFEANKPTDPRQAMITFWQTGDKSALTALQPPQPTMPIDELVTVATTLNQTQRQALFGHPGGPGGPGGPGRGGPGFGGPGKGGPGPMPGGPFGPGM